MSRILITGGAGFIGSHVCDALVARGYEVVVVDDFSSGSRANLAQLEGRVRIIEGSVLDLVTLTDDIGPVDTIIHLAALISGYDSLQDPDAYVETNITGLNRVIDFAGSQDDPRILFASSSTVYGNQPDPVMSEATTPNPLTMYALSKLTGEHMLAMYAELRGYSYVCLRLFNVYGPRQSPNHPYANVTCKFSYAAARGEGVKLFGDGKQSRDFVYVVDVVQAILLVLEDSPQHIYNVGTGSDASILELLETVQTLGDAPVPVEQCPPWPNDIRAIRADVSRLTSDCGYAAGTSLREGLSKTVAYFQTDD